MSALQCIGSCTNTTINWEGRRIASLGRTLNRRVASGQFMRGYMSPCLVSKALNGEKAGPKLSLEGIL